MIYPAIFMSPDPGADIPSFAGFHLCDPANAPRERMLERWIQEYEKCLSRISLSATAPRS